MVITTLTLVGVAGWLIATEIRQRRELADFRARLDVRLAPRWQAAPAEGELEGGA